MEADTREIRQKGSQFPHMAKSILVTGAGGFIGSHLVEHLARQGHQVRAFIHYNSQNNWGWLEKSSVRDQVEFVSGDLRDYDSVSRAIDGVECVYHLGALIGIPYSYVSPLAYVKTNVEGTYNVLESARRAKLKRIIVTSTSEVYGTARTVPISEAHPLQPQSPYSASKIGADQLALSYFNSFECPVVVARPFNTYGPRQSARAIIPTITVQLLEGYKEIELGNVDPTRDLTFVQDTVTGLQAIAETDSFLGKCVNIGTQTEISIQGLFDKLCSLTGKSAQIKRSAARVRPGRSEVERLVSNNDFLRAETSWSPKHSLNEGLQLTIDWLKEHRSLYKAGIFNV